MIRWSQTCVGDVKPRSLANDGDSVLGIPVLRQRFLLICRPVTELLMVDLVYPSEKSILETSSAIPTAGHSSVRSAVPLD